MTSQLKQKGINDRRFKYNADGIIKANVCVCVLSFGSNSNDKGKSSFDHYKAMFGMLAIIRTLVQLYSKASFDVFSMIKIHYLVAQDSTIRHWTMSTQAPWVNVMNKEQRVEVPATFSQNDIIL
ncbi:hypothetical protein CLU79DRAFT_799969 [Phycomyces nitens]|nr:hypothetical protein CLU79DRAFT_799969 [Phycomyces nitens]